MVKQDDFKTRLLIEKLALDEKIEKLIKFIGSEPYHALETFDRYLLNEQLNNMERYQANLQTRILRVCGLDAKLDDETIEEIKQESRLLKAIAATKELPGGWTIDVSFDCDGGLVFLCNTEGDVIPRDQIYDDFASLPTQIENAIAYAKANAEAE